MATKVILREHDALESKYASSDVFGLLWGFGRPDFGALGCFSQTVRGSMGLGSRQSFGLCI